MIVIAGLLVLALGLVIRDVYRHGGPPSTPISDERGTNAPRYIPGCTPVPPSPPRDGAALDEVLQAGRDLDQFDDETLARADRAARLEREAEGRKRRQ